jgi:5'-nucleotidase (lipoprotein e(P4) family)
MGSNVFVRAVAAGSAAAALTCAVAFAQPATSARSLEIKYMRDSAEYQALARQIYRLAADAVRRGAAEARGAAWAVVLDVDETALDNSTYELERAAYGLPFDIASFNAWALRLAAPAVPGAVDFVTAVRDAGGRIAWITNRDSSTTEATRTNLERAGLWTTGDLLCLPDRPERTKAVRRAEVVAGAGTCAWPGTPMRIVAFVGDQLGDFPAAAENIAGTGVDSSFGRICFLLPNSMYGQWNNQVTRR